VGVEVGRGVWGEGGEGGGVGGGGGRKGREGEDGLVEKKERIAGQRFKKEEERRNMV